MTTVTVYGDLYGSRAWWTAWACRELGLEVDNVALGFLGPELKRDDFLKLNPNGMIPTVVDGDYVLWESMAINLYLAKKYGGSLYPSSLEGEALAWQWSFWAVTRLEVPLLTLRVAGMDLPADSELASYFPKHVPYGSPEELARCRNVLEAPLKVLDGEVANRDYILGYDFTIADLNVAAIVSRNSGSVPALRAGRSEVLIDLAPLPHLTEWLYRCWSRASCPLREGLVRSLETV